MLSIKSSLGLLVLTSLLGACSGCGGEEKLQKLMPRPTTPEVKPPMAMAPDASPETMPEKPVIPWDYAVYPANPGPIQEGPPGGTFLISSFRVHAYRALRVDAFEMTADKIHNVIEVEVNGQPVESTRDWGTAPERGLDRLAKGVDIAENQDTTISVYGTVTADWNYTDDHHTRMTPVWAYLPSGELAKVDPEYDSVERTYRTIARQ